MLRGAEPKLVTPPSVLPRKRSTNGPSPFCRSFFTNSAADLLYRPCFGGDRQVKRRVGAEALSNPSYPRSLGYPPASLFSSEAAAPLITASVRYPSSQSLLYGMILAIGISTMSSAPHDLSRGMSTLIVLFGTTVSTARNPVSARWLTVGERIAGKSSKTDSRSAD